MADTFPIDAAFPSQSGIPAIRYEKYHFLVIDDMSASRQSMRQCIQSMGGFHVDFAGTYGEAIYRLKNGTALPDIVLCDFNLNDARDGQQLLEELRRNALIPDDSVFMMVTAERTYEKVVSVVELAPDDYILKPFTPDKLKIRLNRLVEKKLFFKAFFAAIRRKDHKDALMILDDLEQTSAGRRFLFDIMRKRSETLLAAGMFDKAAESYRNILSVSPFPWAKAGLAKAEHALGNLDAARKEIDFVVNSAPKYFEAQDLKAQICVDMGDLEEAQRTLHQLSKSTPKNYLRKRTLAEVATLNGDMETARAAMKDVIENDSHPGAITVTERFSMARIAAVAGDGEGVQKALDGLSVTEFNGLSFNEALSYKALLSVTGAPEDLLAARDMIKKLRNIPHDMGVDIVLGAVSSNDEALADDVVTRLLSCHTTKKAFKTLRSIYEREGLLERFKVIQRKAAEGLIAAKAEG